MDKIRILLFDDDPKGDRSIRFNRIGIPLILKHLKGKESPFAARFLRRNLSFELQALKVNDYKDLRAKFAILKEPQIPTILLLDCEMPGSERSGPRGVGIVDVFPEISLDGTIAIVLATSYSITPIILEIKNSLPAALPYVVPTGTTACDSDVAIIENIVLGLLHWEALQSGPYDALFQELLISTNADILSAHPPDGNNERTNLLNKHFPSLLSLPKDFLDRQLYEMANSEAEGGVGLAGAWLLSLLKASELYPMCISSAFPLPSSLTPWKRTGRSYKHPFIPPQTAYDRFATISAFGKMCQKLFVDKNADHPCALKSATLILDGETSERIDWLLSWAPSTFPANVAHAYTFLGSKLPEATETKAKRVAKPKHDASNSLVAFLMSTMKTINENNFYYLSGACVNIGASEYGKETVLSFFD